MMTSGITAADASRQLTACGFAMTERRLIDWRHKGWLPDLVRVDPPSGRGRGAYYVWPDCDVVVQVFSLLTALEIRGRLETAAVLTWMSGFEYPIETMRSMWAEFEEMPWRNALWPMGAGAPARVDDAIAVLVDTAKATRKGRGLSREYVDTLIRLDIDPNFDPASYLTQRRVELILGDLSRLSPPESAVFVGLIPPEHLKNFCVFIQDYWSAPKLVALINSLSNEELAAVHHDIRVVFGPYRTWLAGAISDVSVGEPNDMALWLGPRLAWKLGRFLMLVDIALRRLGFGRHIEATLDLLAKVINDPEIRGLLARYWSDCEDIMATPGADKARIAHEFHRRSKSNADYKRVHEISDFVIAAVEDIWRPVAGDIVEAVISAASVGGRSPAPTAIAKSA